MNTLMETYKRISLAFESGSGAWLIDTMGNRYLDALAGIAVCGLGHAHPDVQKALSKQASKLVHTSNIYEITLQHQLADELSMLSGLDKVFFCNSGAEANEAAIKICRKYGHEKGNPSPVIVAMEESFHGRTLATLTATGNQKIKYGFDPLIEGFIHIPYNDIVALEKICNTCPEVVAVMLEPIQGEGGVVVPDHGYLKKVSELCAERDLLLVLDEIQTGMCRTGKWFACQYDQVLPDIMTLAKSLGNGVPIGACLANKKAAAPMTPGSHASTFGGNPLCASAALAVIHFMRQHKIDQRVADLGKKMLVELRHKLGTMNGVREVRGLGLMIGIELDMNCPEVVSEALKRKLLINVTAGKVIRLLPPLIITDDEANQIIDTVSDIVTEFVSG